MATTSTFSAILKRYMPLELLDTEMAERNYFWKKVEKDGGWKPGATLEVPFVGNEASSLSMGALTSSTDVAEADYVMGTLSTMPEMWGKSYCPLVA